MRFNYISHLEKGGFPSKNLPFILCFEGKKNDRQIQSKFLLKNLSKTLRAIRIKRKDNDFYYNPQEELKGIVEVKCLQQSYTEWTAKEIHFLISNLNENNEYEVWYLKAIGTDIKEIIAPQNVELNNLLNRIPRK